MTNIMEILADHLKTIGYVTSAHKYQPNVIVINLRNRKFYIALEPDKTKIVVHVNNKHGTLANKTTISGKIDLADPDMEQKLIRLLEDQDLLAILTDHLRDLGYTAHGWRGQSNNAATVAWITVMFCPGKSNLRSVYIDNNGTTLRVHTLNRNQIGTTLGLIDIADPEMETKLTTILETFERQVKTHEQ